MTRVPRLSLPLLFIGILCAAPPARADVIHITSGALVGDLFAAHVTLSSPDHGFSLSASGDRSSGTYALSDCNFNECLPGDTLSLRAAWNGVDFGGVATIDGSTFPLGNIDNSTGAASVVFDGMWTAPPFTGVTTASVVAPFTFSGEIAYPDAFMLGPHTLAGSGVATIALEWNEVFSSWGYAGSRYEFADVTPTPEPGTLLLVAPFAAGLLRRSFRRSARA